VSIRQVGSLKREEHSQPGTIARNEMDTMADTCCAGRNWTLLETTGTICQVSVYDGASTMAEVPVGTCATIVRDEYTGLEYALIGHEMLWFGQKLDRSLLNQNQIRYMGHTVKDDPTQDADGFGNICRGIGYPVSDGGNLHIL
jgi:hypothetical protein